MGVVFEARAASVELNGATILRDLSFSLRAGEWTFLYGPPGAGKTTLVRLVAGALAPASGVVERNGKAALILHDHPMDDQALAIDIVARAFGGADGRQRAQALLEDLGLEAYFNHEPFRLSRGHRKRLAIAEAIASGARLVCLDDPFSPLDRDARARTADVLRDAAEAGVTILMSSNDPLDGLRHADRIVLMSAGPAARIVAIHANVPAPEASADALAARPLHRQIEATLWGEDA